MVQSHLPQYISALQGIDVNGEFVMGSGSTPTVLYDANLSYKLSALLKP